MVRDEGGLVYISEGAASWSTVGLGADGVWRSDVARKVLLQKRG